MMRFRSFAASSCLLENLSLSCSIVINGRNNELLYNLFLFTVNILLQLIDTIDYTYPSNFLVEEGYCNYFMLILGEVSLYVCPSPH